MYDMTMDNDNRSSLENSPECSLSNETVQQMGESSMSDEGNLLVRTADKKQKASIVSTQKDDQIKSFAYPSNSRTTDNVPAENKLHPNQDSPLPSDERQRTNEKIKKFEKNLEKFMKGREPLKEVQLRKKTEISARLVRSDGEMAKIIDYCGDVLKLSSTYSNTKRLSAPPTLSNQNEVQENTGTENNESNNGKVIQKSLPQTSDLSKKYSVETKNAYPKKALDLRLSKISEFKVPISPDKKSPKKSPKTMPFGLNEDDVTPPVQRRPTHFNFKPRKAFYTFSPSSSSGVLRQCQSLPDINRPRRKCEAYQRKSITFGEHSRIVRSLFKEIPEPVTPECKVSTFYKSCDLLEKTEITDKCTEGVTKALQNVPSKICRKLVFDPCSKEIEDKNQREVIKETACVSGVQRNTCPQNAFDVQVQKTLQNHPSKICRKLVFEPVLKETTYTNQQTGVPCDEESPPKRKNVSPGGIWCSISTKKIKTSLQKLEESRNDKIVTETKNRRSLDVKCPISAKKFGTKSNLETKSKEGASEENEILVDVGGSVSVEVGISPGTKMERNFSGENVRKNATSIDLECSISTKKIKASSDITVKKESCENVGKRESPADV